MVKVIYRDKMWDVKAGSTVRDVILKLGMNPEGVLAMRGGRLISEEVLTEEGDTIKLVAVVSGG
jgi:sulfur carrier protein ThiS